MDEMLDLSLTGQLNGVEGALLVAGRRCFLAPCLVSWGSTTSQFHPNASIGGVCTNQVPICYSGI